MMTMLMTVVLGAATVTLENWPLLTESFWLNESRAFREDHCWFVPFFITKHYHSPRTLFRSILGCWVEERGEEKKKMRRERKLTGWRWAKCYYKIDIGFWLYIILSFTLLFFTVILQVLLFPSIFQTLQFLFSCLNTLFSPSCLSISVHTVFLMRLNYLTLRLCDY